MFLLNNHIFQYNFLIFQQNHKLIINYLWYHQAIFKCFCLLNKISPKFVIVKFFIKKKMNTKYVINLVEGQHFKNLKLPNEKIQNVLYQEFDLIQWLLGRSKQQEKPSNSVKLEMLFVQIDNKMTKINLIEDISQGSKDKIDFFTQFKIKNDFPNQNAKSHKLLIVEYKNTNCINVLGQNLKPIVYQLYLYSQTNQTQNQCKQQQFDSNKIQQLTHRKDTLFGTIDVEFQSNLQCNLQLPNLAQRNHIKMTIQQTRISSKGKSLLNTLTSLLGVQGLKSSKPYIPMKMSSLSSYLSIQRGGIRQMRAKAKYKQPKQGQITQKQHPKTNFQFIFRNFNSQITKSQYTETVFEFAKKSYEKSRQKNQKAQNNRSQKGLNNQSQENKWNSTNIPIHHFVSHLSESLIAFLLSLSPILSYQFTVDILQKYSEILYPSYSQFLNVSKQSKSTVKMSQSVFLQIKKTLNFVINQLILQYSKEISAMASQLSFIFQITQLINKSVITNQLIEKILEILFLYGGRFPSILLQADQWFEQLKKQSQLNQHKSKKQSQKQKLTKQQPNSKNINLKQKIGQDTKVQTNGLKDELRQCWFSLYQMIIPGVLTRSKDKISPLIRRILEKVNVHESNGQLTFQHHFKLTSNALTIVAFDITSQTVRFFNYLTVPKMNIVELLTLRQKFQCIRIAGEWIPYRVQYQNQTFLINLSSSLMINPIAVPYLEQYLDNREARKRYFNFSSQSFSTLDQSNTNLNWKKYVFGQGNLNKQMFKRRQAEFSLKRKALFSDIKRIIRSNIPKKKLVWHILKFKLSPQESARKESDVHIVKKIQIVSYFYNIVKTLKKSQKNLCKEIWLQSQINLHDLINEQKKNYLQKGKQIDRVKWQHERVKFMKSLILQEQRQSSNLSKKENPKYSPAGDSSQKKIESFSDCLRLNLIEQMKTYFPGTYNLSETQKFSVGSYLLIKLANFGTKILIQLKQLNKKPSYQVEQFTKAICQAQDKIRKYLLWEKNYSQIDANSVRSARIQDEQPSVAGLQRFLDEQIVQRIVHIEQNNQNMHQGFLRIKQLQKAQIQAQFKHYFQVLSQAYNQKQANLIQSKWFQIQVTYRRLILHLMGLLNNSMTLNSQQIKLKLFYECGLRQVQIYDKFYTNSTLIQHKIQRNLLNHCSQGNIQSHYQNRNFDKQPKDSHYHQKINLYLDSIEDSEIDAELNLKIIFLKLYKIQSDLLKVPPKSYIDVKTQQKSQIQISYDPNNSSETFFPIQKHFESFTCSGYYSITMLQIILRNNFPQRNSTKGQNFQQIISKLPSLKHLLYSTDNQIVRQIFDSFQWHIIEQKQVQNFYRQVYTEDYMRQIQAKSELSQHKIKQIHNKFNNKIISDLKKVQKSKFYRERTKITRFLVCQILQQWNQVLKSKPMVKQHQNKYFPQLDDLIERKVLYNNSVLEKYSALEKQDIIDLLKKFFNQFGEIIQELFSTLLDQVPHAKDQWKGIFLKNSLSLANLKKYVESIFRRYDLNPNLTFFELHKLSQSKFKGHFNIILWNCQDRCLQVCNYTKKPNMPIWFAIISACSSPLYTREQYSHQKWQKGLEQQGNRDSFRQFHRQNNTFTTYSMNTQQKVNNQQRASRSKTIDGKLLKQSRQTQNLQFSAELVHKQSVNKDNDMVKKPVIPSMIDQNVKKYLNLNLLESYPLIYLTNSMLQVMPSKNNIESRLVCLSFEKDDNQIFHSKKDFFEGSSVKVNIAEIFSLFLNKKDKHLQSLRHFLRRTFAQMHFYCYAQTLLEGNRNQYRKYAKSYKDHVYSQKSQQQQFIDVLSASSSEQISIQNQDHIIGQNLYIQEYQNLCQFEQDQFEKVKISKISIKNVDSNGDIIDLNQNNEKQQYIFHRTFEEANKISKKKSKKLQIMRIQNPGKNSAKSNNLASVLRIYQSNRMRNKLQIQQATIGSIGQERQIQNNTFSKDTSLNVYALLLKKKSVISLRTSKNSHHSNEKQLHQ